MANMSNFMAVKGDSSDFGEDFVFLPRQYPH